MKTGVILVNVGTPDSPKVSDVRRYLTEFLNDPFVIDLPWVTRSILVNGIIVPFRAPASAKLYKELWTDEGSPLIVNSERCAQELQDQLGADYLVRIAMRYQNPSIRHVANELSGKVDRMVVVPMYPQYAESSTRTSIEKVKRELARIGSGPDLRFVPAFYDDKGYIDAFVERIAQAGPDEYDHVLFSFHGLPNRHLVKLHASGQACAGCDCEKKRTEDLEVCYKAQCYDTVRSIVNELNLSEGKYSVGFQSRLDKKWLTPFSDKLIEQYGKNGMKRLLVACPSFVADCLETTIEIGVEYKELFVENGGEQLDLVESLNYQPTWVNALKELVLAN